MKYKDDWNSPDLNVNCNSDSEYKLKHRGTNYLTVDQIWFI